MAAGGGSACATGTGSGIRQRDGAIVGCVDVDDNVGDAALVGSGGRSDLLLRLMRWLAAVCSWYERKGNFCVTVASVFKSGIHILYPTFQCVWFRAR